MRMQALPCLGLHGSERNLARRWAEHPPGPLVRSRRFWREEKLGSNLSQRCSGQQIPIRVEDEKSVRTREGPDLLVAVDP